MEYLVYTNQMPTPTFTNGNGKKKVYSTKYSIKDNDSAKF
jgi:hypothetical protein